MPKLLLKLLLVSLRSVLLLGLASAITYCITLGKKGSFQLYAPIKYYEKIVVDTLVVKGGSMDRFMLNLVILWFVTLATFKEKN